MYTCILSILLLFVWHSSFVSTFGFTCYSFWRISWFRLLIDSASCYLTKRFREHSPYSGNLMGLPLLSNPFYVDRFLVKILYILSSKCSFLSFIDFDLSSRFNWLFIAAILGLTQLYRWLSILLFTFDSRSFKFRFSSLWLEVGVWMSFVE